MTNGNTQLTCLQDETEAETLSTSKTLEPFRHIELLFDRLSKLYGTRFLDMWSGVDLEGMKEVWADYLAGYTVDEIKRGLKACATHPFAPTLPEFLMMCRPPIDFQEQFREACTQLAKRPLGKDKWPSKALFWAAVEFGTYDMQSSTWDQVKRRWTALLTKKMEEETSLPDVPPFRQALPPARTEESRQAAREAMAKIKEMLDERVLQRV